MIGSKWEIWWVKFVYDDDPFEFKIRPALIVDRNQALILGAKITTHPPRVNFLMEYELKAWKQIGLEKASTVRLSQVIELRESDLHQYIGKLQNSDISNIQFLLSVFSK